MATTDPPLGDPQWEWTFPNTELWQLPMTMPSIQGLPAMPSAFLTSQELLRQIQEAQEAIMANRQLPKQRAHDREMSHLYKVLKLIILLMPEPQRGLLMAVLNGEGDAAGQLFDLLEENGVDVSSFRTDGVK